MKRRVCFLCAFCEHHLGFLSSSPPEEKRLPRKTGRIYLLHEWEIIFLSAYGTCTLCLIILILSSSRPGRERERERERGRSLFFYFFDTLCSFAALFPQQKR